MYGVRDAGAPAAESWGAGKVPGVGAAAAAGPASCRRRLTRLVRDQRVGRQAVLGPDLEVAPGGGQRGAAERVTILLEQQGGHLWVRGRVCMWVCVGKRGLEGGGLAQACSKRTVAGAGRPGRHWRHGYGEAGSYLLQQHRVVALKRLEDVCRRSAEGGGGGALL